MLLVKRGNIHKELSQIGEDSGEGTEIQAITLFKLMRAFERVAKRLEERNNKPVHTVVRYNYTMEDSRERMLNAAKTDKVLSFEKIFDACAERLEAIFTFLALLELVQQKYLSISMGEGKNNFIIEWNEEREEDIPLLFQ
jgi:segregation and condensation protein A